MSDEHDEQDEAPVNVAGGAATAHDATVKIEDEQEQP